MNSEGLKDWLRKRMEKENLSLRKAAAMTDLSHGTIADILKGVSPSAETVRKLAHGFVSGNGQERLALEDELLILAGHRTGRPEAEDVSPTMGRLLDAVASFSEPQLNLMSEFAKFLSREGR
uniref:Putative DNA binding, helix-turn-helix domain containing protein n=1 Tax=viral metagenome TaxID=1070528 RepID=A0A6H1Z7J5_9ZZZZ